MDMFAEMGDKIALQYGGSEAHNKVKLTFPELLNIIQFYLLFQVLAGKSGQAASSSKQSELLTSIKRYYSNAFTDMVKQDAMNIFLGCFVPNEVYTSFYYLNLFLFHNVLL